MDFSSLALPQPQARLAAILRDELNAAESRAARLL
jgi:hypothetical protein